MKTIARCILLLLSMGTAVSAQESLAPMAREATPGFEVATIKSCDPDDQSSGFHTNGRRIYIECETADQMIMFAYGVHQSQIVSAPSWFASERFDVRGTPDVPGYPNTKQLRGMVEKLLVERFGVGLHRDRRELNVLEMTVDKHGAKLKESAHSADDLPDQTGDGRGTLRCTNTTMPEFAATLQFMLGKPMQDATRLAGRYDFTLRWSPQLSTTSDPNAPPALETALGDELGLKIAPEKRQADVLVIDHATKPSAN